MDKLLEAKVYRSIPIQEIRESGCMIYKILQEADVRTSENSLVPNEELSRVMRCVGQQRRRNRVHVYRNVYWVPLRWTVVRPSSSTERLFIRRVWTQWKRNMKLDRILRIFVCWGWFSQVVWSCLSHSLQFFLNIGVSSRLNIRSSTVIRERKSVDEDRRTADLKESPNWGPLPIWIKKIGKEPQGFVNWLSNIMYRPGLTTSHIVSSETGLIMKVATSSLHIFCYCQFWESWILLTTGGLTNLLVSPMRPFTVNVMSN